MAATTKVARISLSLPILFALLCMLAVACATAYQRRGFSGGYEDERLGHGRYFVSFQGNGFTDRGTVVRYLHRRATELCASEGFNDYVVVDNVHDAHVTVTKDAVYQKPNSSMTIRCIHRE